MAELLFCEPTKLYNILNQATDVSRLTEPNYLYLFDVRPKVEYDESHVITAIRVKKKGSQYLIPESVDLDCVRYCVVYDKNTSSLAVRLKMNQRPKEDKSKVKLRRPSQQSDHRRQDAKDREDKGDKADKKGKANEEGEDEEEEEEESQEESEEENEEEENAPELAVGPAVRFGRILVHHTRHPVYILRGGYEYFTSLYHFLRTQKIIWMPQRSWAYVKQCKPTMQPNCGLVSQLLEWENIILGIYITDITQNLD